MTFGVHTAMLFSFHKVASLLRENAGAKTEAGLRAGDLQQRLSAAQEELAREREAFAERKVSAGVGVGGCGCFRVLARSIDHSVGAYV